MPKYRYRREPRTTGFPFGRETAATVSYVRAFSMTPFRHCTSLCDSHVVDADHLPSLSCLMPAAGPWHDLPQQG